MNKKQKLAELMAKDSFEDWMELLELEKVKRFVLGLNPEKTFTSDLLFIRACVKGGISLEGIQVMLPLPYSKRMIIKEAFLQFNEHQDIFLVAKSGLNEYKMDEICKVVNKGKTKELIDLLKKDFNELQTIQICLGVLFGLEMKEIKIYAKEGIEYQHMRVVREMLQKKYPINQINLLANENLNCSQAIKLAELMVDAMPYSKLKFLANPAFEGQKTDALVRCFECGMKIKEVEQIAHLTWQQIEAIVEGKVHKYSPTYNEYCMNSQFDNMQFLEIARAYSVGLSEAVIAMFAKPEYEYKVMRLFINCARDGFTDEQLQLLISVGEDIEKFQTLVLAISNGAKDEQINQVLTKTIKTNEEKLLDKLLA